MSSIALGGSSGNPGSATSPLLQIARGADPAPCDLLYAQPLGRLNRDSAAEALSFAFASGDGDVFRRLMDSTPVAASEFQASDFAEDLMLRPMVQRCMPVVAAAQVRVVSGEHLYRVVSAPPADRRHVSFRQEICAELASSPQLTNSLESLFLHLCTFRDRIGRPSVGRQEGIDRRLGVLASIKEIVDCLSQQFAGATSGLARLHRFGAEWAGSEGYGQLQQLLVFERSRAELDIRVRLGFDGSIRALHTLSRREERSNPFYESLLGRVWTWLSYWVSGYRVGRSEVLSRLLDDVFSQLQPRAVFLFQLLGDVEVYLASLGMRRVAAQAGLEMSLPEFSDAPERELHRLFNPWLVSEGLPCVPCSLVLGVKHSLSFVTGPNSGGKTRLLQSLALTQLLGQAGLFVPAARAHLCWASGLVASLIENVHGDQTEGRLGTELMRIRRLFERSAPGAMVLLDELCSGTNPQEGQQLIELVLEYLQRLRPQAFITTHFLQFAASLHGSGRRFGFLQVALDADQRPTYEFAPGVAATSLAHRVAERLGVTADDLEQLVQRAAHRHALRRTEGRLIGPPEPWTVVSAAASR